MAHTSPTPTAGTLSVRPGASRSLLAKKARERLQREVSGEPIEAAFPRNLALAKVDGSSPETREAEAPAAEGLVEAAGAFAGCQVGNSARQPAAVPGEALRRPRAGDAPVASVAFTQPVRESRLLTSGSITPNPGTVFAIITGIVQERGQLTRPELLVAMASTSFPQPKARPDSKAWCQGYIAGAIRSGFIAQVELAYPAVSVPSSSNGEV